MDISNTVIAKSAQLNSDDLLGGPITIHITAVKANEGTPDQPVAVHYHGDDGKPFLPCKTVRRAMISCWGPDASKYVGRRMTLYRDPDVVFGGMKVGGIRISHMSDIEKEAILMLTTTRAKKAPVRIKPLASPQQTQQPAPEPDNALELCEAAARNGTEAFRAWWGSDEGKSCRATAQANIDRLKQLASDADGPADEDGPPM